MAQRQSNIELLRIISMAMIVIVHLDVASLGLSAPAKYISDITARHWWQLIVESAVIIGVNCFTLISGYFGIHARWSGFWKLTAQCMFYAVGIYSALAIAGLVPWNLQTWLESWMVYTHTDLWYVPAYLGLFLLSPFINAAVTQLSRKQFGIWLGAFILFNVWAGWVWGGRFNPTGYTVIQLVMMYLIGRYIGLYAPAVSCPKKLRLSCVIIYIAATAGITLYAGLVDISKTFAYNSPLVIISSVAFFLIFTTFRFKSGIINSIASSAFAVYLIHKNPYIWGGFMKRLSVDVWSHNDLLVYSAYTLAFTAGVFIVACVVDSFRRLLFRLIETLFGNKVKINL